MGDEVDCPTKPACENMDVNITGCGHRFFTQNIVNNPHHKIVGGIKAVKGAYPYQISLRFYGRHWCGGTIVDKTTIISAAHCFGGPASSYSIVAGEHSISDGADCTEQHIEVKEILIHPSYGYNGHDIAIIKLKTGLQFNKYVQPA